MDERTSEGQISQTNDRVAPCLPYRPALEGRREEWKTEFIELLYLLQQGGTENLRGTVVEVRATLCESVSE